MDNPVTRTKAVLITGGTSGFGLELARVLLNRDWMVVVTGRTLPSLQTKEHRFSFFKVDFSNLEETAKVVRQICKYHSFDVIVDNAGVLSPPDYTLTADNLEYTYQVNFLAQFLLNELIIRNAPKDHPLKIAAIISPVYKYAGTDLITRPGKIDYQPHKAYSKSKLYLALMCSYLPSKVRNPELHCFSFNPGVFRSGIYRTQSPWFRLMYKVAAPLMRSPRNNAARLADLLEENSVRNGSIYNSRKKFTSVPIVERTIYDLFWKECYSNLEKYLRN
jgi:NAD(P)-dependent dehydrogenase (short-subunit alcohol dehydrogenase family)